MNLDFNLNSNEESTQRLLPSDKELSEETEIESAKILEVVYCFRKVSHEMTIKPFSMVKRAHSWQYSANTKILENHVSVVLQLRWPVTVGMYVFDNYRLSY